MIKDDRQEKLEAIARIAQASIEGCMWCAAALNAQKKGDKVAPCPNTYHVQFKEALRGL